MLLAQTASLQLDEQCRKWLADATRNRFDAAQRRAEISAIFDWFKDDFVRDGGSVAGWLAKYAPEEHREWLSKGEVELGFLDYSWKLNAPAK